MKYADLIHQALNEDASPKMREQLINATIAFYLETKAKIESGDPEQKRQAMQEAAEIQKILTEKQKELSQQTGLSPDQMSEISRHLGEHEAVAEARAKLAKALRPASSASRRLSKSQYIPI